ncbi:hypothetical protein ES702_03561 [subsurface metagenome]
MTDRLHIHVETRIEEIKQVYVTRKRDKEEFTISTR